MEEAHADIILRNSGDVSDARKGIIEDEQIRYAEVKVMVDTGAMTLVISEELRQQLGLGIYGLREVTLANDVTDTARVTDPVEVIWEGRSFIGQAWVISGWGEPLLGLLPLEYMDLMVDPVNQKLVGVHGDDPIGMAKLC
ncbi:MAG: retropepsin-like domain-containing protein [Treponema sp.]|nr:retropepsin-like domain-containing protein [Treponema sp.]